MRGSSAFQAVTRHLSSMNGESSIAAYEGQMDAGDSARAMPRSVWSVLLLILILAGGIRFNHLDRESRWGDEYEQTTCYDMSPKYVILRARAAEQPPLDYLIGWALARFDNSLWTMRAPAAFFGTLGAAACFVLVRRVMGWREGLAAALVLAVCPLHYQLSQTARPYTIFIAALLVMLWTLSRALEHPNRKRLAAYAVAAYVMTLTRNLGPPVILLATGIVAGCAWMGARWSRASSEEVTALRRVTLVTIAVGVAAVPMLVFIATGGQSVSLVNAGRPAEVAIAPPYWSRMVANTAQWLRTSDLLFGPMAFGMLGLALIGSILALTRWPSLPCSRRIMFAIVWLAGPLYLLVFSAVIRDRVIFPRLGLFMAPIVAMFAALAVVRLAEMPPGINAGAQKRRKLAACAAAVGLVLIVASPALTTVDWTRRYFNPDWQSCAAFLASRTTADDVILVFQDRPLGEYQPTFWGKCDWPDRLNGDDRPLAEPAWVLATSRPHYERLLAKTGACYIVVRHAVQPQSEWEYLEHGLQSAPEGMQLIKFRGIDLLMERQPSTEVTQRWIDACNVLIALPRENAESVAIPLTLRSRLELLRGDAMLAEVSFSEARTHVPAQRQDWFEQQTRAHAAELESGLAGTRYSSRK